MAPGVSGDLGCVDARCHGCGAYLSLFPDDTVACLNLCDWPVWMEREFQAGLRDAIQRVAAKQRVAEEVLAVL